MKDYRQYVAEMAKKAAKEAFMKYIHSLYDDCYLYYGTGILKAIRNTEKTKLKLAINEHLPKNLTVEQLTYWIISRIGQLPFLPV